jgi:hypothetical protein
MVVAKSAVPVVHNIQKISRKYPNNITLRPAGGWGQYPDNIP